MLRRTFIKAAAATAAAAASPSMQRLNLPELGVFIDGQLVVLELTQPAAGAGYFITVPFNYAFEILSISYTLAASVAVASRQPVVFVSAPGKILFQAVTASTIIAGGTGNITFAQGFGANLSTATIHNISLGRFICPPGSLIEADSLLFQAADQLTNGMIVGIARPLT